MDFGLCWNQSYCVTIQFVSNFSTLSRVSVNAILINFFCSLPTWRKSLIVIYDFFSFSLLGAFNVVGVSFPPCLHHLTVFCEITTTLNFKCHVPLKKIKLHPFYVCSTTCLNSLNQTSQLFYMPHMKQKREAQGWICEAWHVSPRF